MEKLSTLQGTKSLQNVIWPAITGRGWEDPSLTSDMKDEELVEMICTDYTAGILLQRVSR